MADNSKDLAAQSVVVSENGEASLLLQTVDGGKFSCSLTQVEEPTSDSEPEASAEGEETPVDPTPAGEDQEETPPV